MIVLRELTDAASTQSSSQERANCLRGPVRFELVRTAELGEDPLEARPIRGNRVRGRSLARLEGEIVLERIV